MGYSVVCGGNFIWFIVWRVVVICYGLLCGKWCNLLRDIVWRGVVIYGLLNVEKW